MLPDASIEWLLYPFLILISNFCSFYNFSMLSTFFTWVLSCLPVPGMYLSYYFFPSVKVNVFKVNGFMHFSIIIHSSQTQAPVLEYYLLRVDWIVLRNKA